MVDLAPHNPFGLLLRTRLLARLGYGGAGLALWSNEPAIGGLVTEPLGERDRPWAAPTPTPAGLVLRHAGRALAGARRDLPRWAAHHVPVLVALRAKHPADTSLLDALDPEAHAGLVLDICEADDPAATAAAFRRRWLRPLIVECAAGASLAPLAGLGLDGVWVGRGPFLAAAGSWLCGPAADPLILDAVATARAAHPDLALWATVAGTASAKLASEYGVAAIVQDIAGWAEGAALAF